MIIYTASWFTKLPAEIKRIGVSRGTPRGQPGGYKLYRELNPGDWFRTASLSDYIPLYGKILAGLDPKTVVHTLETFSQGADCAMLCYENPTKIHAGEDFCHRHLVAQWLEDKLGIEVKEYGHPELSRFAALDAADISRPRYT